MARTGRLPCPSGALPLIHISEPTRLLSISYAAFCLKKKNIISPFFSLYVFGNPAPYLIVSSLYLSLPPISDPTRLMLISYPVFFLHST